MKNLFLMSQSGLIAYIKARSEAEKRAEAMTTADIEANTKLVVEGSLINDVDSDGDVEFDVDSDGIAHIPITGMLKNSIGIIDIIRAVISGQSATTYRFIIRATEIANADPDVKGIRYEINTGGGDVAGIEAASNAIFNSKKPTQALVHSAAESGGFWLGSQADEFIALGKTSFLGSVGVAAEFVDETAAETAQGVQKIILTSTDAPKKRFDIKSDEGQAIIVEMMDEMHAIFVEHIVRGRKKKFQAITPDFVNKKFGQGGTMGAKKALRNKMIDGILSSTSSANGGGRMSVSADPPSTPGADPDSVTNNTGKPMTEKQFLAFLETNPEAKAFYDGAMAYIKAVSDAVPDISALSLTDVLALAPTAKTDHETALTDARATVEAGKLTAEAVKQVGGIIGSAEYGASIKAAGIKVLTGEKDHSSFEDLVALADEQNEKIKALQIEGNQPPGTPGDPGLTPAQAAQAKTKASATALSDAINNTENKVQ